MNLRGHLSTPVPPGLGPTSGAGTHCLAPQVALCIRVTLYSPLLLPTSGMGPAVLDPFIHKVKGMGGG